MARSLIMSRPDLDFCLYEWLRVEELTKRDRFAQHDRATFDALLDLSEQVATERFAPINRATDLCEPEVDADGRVVLAPGVAEAVAAYTQTGLPSAVFDDDLGGLQLPLAVRAACGAWFQAACLSAYSYAFLAEGNASLVAAHGTREQAETYARPIVEGRWFGTMCLSEPHAGSSLTDITTRAVRGPDGTYRITGTKMWISAGDHELGENIVHLVLARTPGAAAGVKGISLFIVPRFLLDERGRPAERNDVALAGLNHKMGYRGTANTVLAFGQGAWTPGGHPGAVGFLVGKEGAGLALMFHMMNEARISVGAGAMALGYTGYLHALDYARERVQGRPLGAKDPAAPPVPLVEHPDVRRMLLAQKSYAEGALGLVLYCARLIDEERTAPGEAERRTAHDLLDILTPIVKSWPAQWCLAANDLAIQIHGGAGYTRDHPVEQFYRDNRLNAIHEGTHGIQALDLLGRKAVRDDGRALAALAAAVRDTIGRAAAAGGDAATYAGELGRVLDDLLDVTQALWRAGDPRIALSNATAYLEAAGHLVVAWIWLDQLVAVGAATGPFAAGKRAAARYFFRFELPAVGPRLDLLRSLDATTRDLDPDVL
ncbi:acyl-CoA dehydrogenase [Dactylosporangium sp. CA-092794]|uniref:acyl-CoA dehydrogenase n=1 Tax=Dactylosporangium sp. CA-092794 TaxID=3239929 RepID=UPI003D92ED86